MQNNLYIPSSIQEALQHLQKSLQETLSELPKSEFLKAWCSLAYLYAGLHPDGFEEPDSGWPCVLKPLGAEAWRRAEAGGLTDEEMYPSSAQWCGLYDGLRVTTELEDARRVILAV